MARKNWVWNNACSAIRVFSRDGHFLGWHLFWHTPSGHKGCPVRPTALMSLYTCPSGSQQQKPHQNNTSVRRNATRTAKSIPHIRGDRVFAHMSTDYWTTVYCMSCPAGWTAERQNGNQNRNLSLSPVRCTSFNYVGPLGWHCALGLFCQPTSPHSKWLTRCQMIPVSCSKGEIE